MVFRFQDFGYGFFLLAYCTDFKGLPTGTGCATFAALLAQIVPVPPDGW